MSLITGPKATQLVGIDEKTGTMSGMKKSTPKKSSSRRGSFLKKKSTKGAAAVSKKKLALPKFEVSDAGVRASVFLGIIILGLGTILWWQFIFLDEQKVFERMLRQTLRTQSVTKVLTQDDSTQSFEEITRLQLGGSPGVVGRTTINQGEPNAAQVVTEQLGTPTQDFVRYTTIQTSEENEQGEVLDYSGVIGIWGVTQQQPEAPAQGQSFNEAIFGILPFANVSKHDQNRLFDFLIEKNVYEVDYLGVTKQNQDGRRVYSYRVSLQPAEYVAYLQELARAQGIDQFQDVNPGDFAGVAPIRFTMDIDVYSGAPILIETAQDQRRESIKDFGRIQDISPPQDAIPSQELQQRLQEVQ